MEIIQNRKTMKIISVLILMIMLIGTITPVFAALSISDVKINDQLKFTGDSWTVYKNEAAAQDTKKSEANGYIYKNHIITVKDKSGNALQIGSNQWIYFSGKYFTKVTDTSKDNPTKDKTQQAAKKDFEIPDLNIDTSEIGTAIGQIGEGLISGIGKIGESGFLENIGQIIMDFINSLVESIRTISINLPTVDTGNLKDLFNVNEEILKLEIDGKTVNKGETITIKVDEKVKVKATVYGEEVKPTYTYAEKKLKMTGNEITGVSKGTGTLFEATYSYKDKELTTNIKINIEETDISTQGSVEAADSAPGGGDSLGQGEQKVYLTNYKATDDGDGNYGTKVLGVVLKKDEDGEIGIVHPNVDKNSKGWYVYKHNGTEYVMVSRLRNKNGSYGGFEDKEIVKFNYKGVTYKGVFIDTGSAQRDYPTIDIYREMGCTDCPSLELSTAVETNQYINVVTNHKWEGHENEYNTILRY